MIIDNGLINVAVFFGGDSVEHEVSIISAVQAMTHLNREKYNVIPVYLSKNGIMYTSAAMFEIKNFTKINELISKSKIVEISNNGQGVILRTDKKNDFSGRKPIKLDVALPIVHGTNCEDGSLQGYFETIRLPYAGCDVLASSVGMDKAVFKSVLRTVGIPVLDCIRFSSTDYSEFSKNIIQRINSAIGYPLIVKPVNLGSSIGISKVNSEADLSAAIEKAFMYSDSLLIERAVQNLREINCSVLGDSNECVASPCEEPFGNDEILSYEDKYTNNSSTKGMASLKRKIPADIPEDLTQSIREFACRTFKAIGGHGVVRIDFLMDNKSKEVFVNEINTIPGSLAFYLWEADGMKYSEMLDKLISLAFSRQRKKENLRFEIDTNILSQCGSFGAKGSKGSKM